MFAFIVLNVYRVHDNVTRLNTRFFQFVWYLVRCIRNELTKWIKLLKRQFIIYLYIHVYILFWIRKDNIEKQTITKKTKKAKENEKKAKSEFQSSEGNFNNFVEGHMLLRRFSRILPDIDNRYDIAKRIKKK